MINYAASEPSDIGTAAKESVCRKTKWGYTDSEFSAYVLAPIVTASTIVDSQKGHKYGNEAG